MADYALIVFFFILVILSASGFDDTSFSNFDYYSDAYEQEVENDTLDLFPFPSLVFPNTSLCLPSLGEFYIVNRGLSDVEIYSIQSTNAQFYPLLQSKIISGNSNLTVKSVFLPFNTTFITSVFQINSSVGNYLYQVKGYGTENLYGVRPYLNNKVYVGNPSMEFPIVIRNPFNESLQILEVFTTDNFIALKGRTWNESVKPLDSTTNKNNWLLEGFSSREVISFSLLTRMPAGFYRGFIHLHTNKDKIIIPVEMDLHNGGITPLNRDLKFGTFTKKNEKKSVDLLFWNFGTSPIKVQSITALYPESRLIIDMEPSTIVSPSPTRSAKVATLNFITKTMDRITGRLLITTNDSNSAYAAFELTYSGIVLTGKIAFSVANTTFYISPMQPHSPDDPANIYQRSIWFSNRFNLPVEVYSVYLTSCMEFLTVNASLIENSIVESFHSFPPLILTLSRFQFRMKQESLPRTCWIEIASNVTLQRIPIHLISGRLELEAFEAEMISNKILPNVVLHEELFQFQLNNLDIQNPRDIRMILSNENPLAVSVRISNTTDRVCICREVSWPKGRYDKRKGLEFLNNMTGVSVEIAERLSSKCACRNSFQDENQNDRDFNRILLKPGYNSLISINFDMKNAYNAVGEFRQSSIQLSTAFQRFYFDFSYKVVSQSVFITNSSEWNDFVLGINSGPRFTITQTESAGVLSTKLYPTFPFLSTVTSPALDHVQIKLVPKFDHEPDYIFGFKIWLSLVTILKEIYTDLASLRITDLLELMDEFKREGNKYNQLHEVFFKLSQLKHLFHRHFPSGIILQNSSIIVRTMNALQYRENNPMTLQLPLSLLSNTFAVNITLSSTQMCSVYLEVRNPFEIDVDFAIFEEHDLIPKSLRMVNPEETYKTCFADQQLPLILSDDERANSKLQRVSKIVNISTHYLRYNYSNELYGSAIVRFSLLDNPLQNTSSCYLKVSNLDTIATRFKSVAWRVKPDKKVVIGPIDFHSSTLESGLYSKTFYIGNSFTGLDKFTATFNTIRPELVLLYADKCAGLNCERILNKSSEDQKLSVKISEKEELQLTFTSSVSPVTISRISIENMTCESYFLDIQDRIRYCKNFPLQLQPHQQIILRLKVKIDCSIKTNMVNICLYESENSLHRILLSNLSIGIIYSGSVFMDCFHVESKSFSFLVPFIFVCFIVTCFYYLRPTIVILEAFTDNSEDSLASTLPLSHSNSSFPRWILSRNLFSGQAISLRYKQIDLDDLKLPLAKDVDVDSLLNNRQNYLNTASSEFSESESDFCFEQIDAHLDSVVFTEHPLSSEEDEDTDVEKILAFDVQTTELLEDELAEIGGGKAGEVSEQTLDMDIGTSLEWKHFHPLSIDPFYSLPQQLSEGTAQVLPAPPGLELGTRYSSEHEYREFNNSNIDDKSFTLQHLTLEQLDSSQSFSWLYTKPKSESKPEFSIWSTVPKYPISNLDSEEIDDASIFQFSSNINELLDDPSEDNYTDEQLQWKHMNSPPKSETANFFGPSGFFSSNLNPTLDCSLEEENDS